MSEKIAVSMKINGKEVTLLSAPEQNLLRLLRENGYVEVKCGCEEGDCGTCTVLLDGLSVKSCVTPACACEGREVWTAAGRQFSGVYEDLPARDPSSYVNDYYHPRIMGVVAGLSFS